MNIRAEAAHIVERAVEHDARMVTLGPLLFFSTETGDAWMLDPADHLALCLARGGDPSPDGLERIVETADRFSVEWSASYAIEGPAFTVAEATRVTSIIGYPTAEIEKAIRRMRAR